MAVPEVLPSFWNDDKIQVVSPHKNLHNFYLFLQFMEWMTCILPIENPHKSEHTVVKVIRDI